MSEKTGEPIDYTGRNARLFAQRKEVLEKIEGLEGQPRKTARVKVDLRRAKRTLEDLEVEILHANRGLVMSYANRFIQNGRLQDQEEYEAAGMAGLVAAMKSYDPGRGSFAQWAYHPIQRNITRAVRDIDYANLNPGDFERRPDILRAREQLQREGSGITYAEVARRSGTTEAQVKRVLAAPRLMSVDRPLGDDGATVGEVVADPAPPPEDGVVRDLAVSALNRWGLEVLDERELYVVTRHFGLDGGEPEKLATIGERMGLSREAARQIEGKALSKMGHPVVMRKLARQKQS